VKALEQQNLMKDNKLQQSSPTKGVMKEIIVRNKVGNENMVSMKVEQESFVTKKWCQWCGHPRRFWGVGGGGGLGKKNVNEMESLN
jgi:hypothetical protein